MTAQEMIRKLIDVFAASDGGVQMMKYRMMMERMEVAAAEGDEPAKQIMQVAERFCRLVDAAQRS